MLTWLCLGAGFARLGVNLALSWCWSRPPSVLVSPCLDAKFALTLVLVLPRLGANLALSRPPPLGAGLALP
jgi:hypothetical protein